MDEKNMNEGFDVTTELSEDDDFSQEITIEETAGPSKGFVALVVGAVATVAIGATMAWKNHKKKKTEMDAVKIIDDEEETQTDYVEDEVELEIKEHEESEKE